MVSSKTKTSLSHRVVKSTMWLFAFQLLDNVLGLIRIIILARLLSPTAFGLVGAAWLVLQIINTFTLTGINHYLIHKNKIDNYLNSAWTFLVIRGIILYACIFIFAPYIGNFLSTSEIILIVQILSLTILINGFSNIGIIYFQKNLEFQKQFKIQITQNTLDFVVTLVFAFIFHNVWAIVLGALANSLCGLVLSYIYSSYRPKFEWNKKKISEMNDYGKWIGGSNILNFLFSQGDDILVSKLLGVTSLGYYQLAYRISNLPATQITHIVSTVMFPAYSQLQNDIPRLSKIYIRNFQVTVALSFFVGIIIILFAYDFTKLFLGDKWLPIVVSMQILTLWGVIRSIGATTGPVWQAIGKPKYITNIQTFQVLLLAVIIIPLTLQWGFNGTSTAVVIACIIPNILAIYYIARTLKLSVFIIIKEMMYPFFAMPLPISWYYTSKNLFTEINFIVFIFNAFITILLYVMTIYLFHKLLKYSIFKNLAQLFPKLSLLNNI